MNSAGLQTKLMWFWDLIDISANMKRVEDQARRITSGTLGHAIVMAVLALISFALAWTFDFESTLIGMSTLRETVLPNLPSSLIKFSIYISLALTLAPTLIELFTSAYAKADVKVMQIYVIAFTGFDLITDIPRAKAFTDQMQAHFDQMGPLFDLLGYWAFFLFWLFLSTIGFELGLILFGYLAILFTLKATGIGAAPSPRSMKSSVVSGDVLGGGGSSGGKVKVVDG